MTPDVVAGPDGTPRCAWPGLAAAPDYAAYHDQEWGVPVHGESALLERVCLEAFQSGLSWLTILRKRPAFRERFLGFDADAVAGFGAAEVEGLLDDAGIVRNRRKIEAAIANAAAVVRLREAGGLDALVWGFAPTSHQRPSGFAEVPAVTAESTAMATALKAAGLRHLGPTTCYALMQSCGLVDDHVAGCHRAAA